MDDGTDIDPVMIAIRKWVAESGLTQQVLGERMGYPATTARQSVSQFLKSVDPRIGTIRRFCRAAKLPLKTLLK
ncbi:MAG: helix-turn-helix transcriptional regulator [Planctomycetaceae bacterium]|nr:helix-turn-helix transcriptional regulator [Planctomycetaceae bacterium]